MDFSNETFQLVTTNRMENSFRGECGWTNRGEADFNDLRGTGWIFGNRMDRLCNVFGAFHASTSPSKNW